MSIRSSSGSQLARAAILSVDSKGKRIAPLGPDFEGIRCNETRPHALSSPDAESSREEQMVQAGLLERARASLTELELYVMQKQRKLSSYEELRPRISTGALAEYLLNGYTLIPGSERVEERPSLPPLTTVEVLGYDVIEVDRLDYERMAEERGVLVSKIKKAVSSAHRKLRKTRR